MQIINVALNDIKEYVDNPREITKKAVEAVKESIRAFGMVNPILIDKENTIIAGHTRFKALKELGANNAPCIRIDNLTQAQIKALRIADNKTSEFSKWDNSFLALELEKILSQEKIDFCFDKIDLDISEFFTIDEIDNLPEEIKEIKKVETIQDAIKNK